MTALVTWSASWGPKIRTARGSGLISLVCRKSHLLGLFAVFPFLKAVGSFLLEWWQHEETPQVFDGLWNHYIHAFLLEIAWNHFNSFQASLFWIWNNLNKHSLDSEYHNFSSNIIWLTY
jgi:hypothetical protein